MMLDAIEPAFIDLLVMPTNHRLMDLCLIQVPYNDILNARLDAIRLGPPFKEEETNGEVVSFELE